MKERQQWDYRKLVFLDETGLNTKMLRLHGRSPRAERCHASAPHGHWKSTTFIAALRHDAITAPLLLDGAINGAAFLAYLQQVLCPVLSPGDVVICDNLSSHKVSGAAKALAAVGASLRYLPAYSPDLNPIEMAFSKFKASLRSASERTFTGLCSASRLALDAFTSSECFNFFRHAQYTTY